MSLQTSEKFLQEIVSTVASSIELAEVLPAVVRLMSDASGVHGCFVYLVEDDRLVLRAASPPYERQVGKVAFERGESLAWWAAEHGEPAFIRESALADPRVKYVPELEEERYQSLLAVPIVSRAGEAIGAITAHTAAPREFTDDEVDFIVTSASLVASAIENARLYEETRLRVVELEQLTELAEAIARAEALDELLQTVATDARPLLGARACHVYLLDPAREELDLQASDPESGNARQTLGLAELGPELARGGRSSRLASRSSPPASSSASSSPRGARGSSSVEPSRARSRSGSRRSRSSSSSRRRTSSRTSSRSSRAAVCVATSRDAPHGSDATSTSRTCPRRGAVERRVLACAPSAAPGSLFDHREDSLRALVSLTTPSSESFLERLRRAHSELAEPVAVGVSSVCRGEASYADGFAEAQQALVGTVALSGEPTVLAYDDLGAYKYLLRVAVDGGIRDATVEPWEARGLRRAARSTAPRDARGVPPAPRLDQRHVRGAVRPPNAAPAAPAVGELSGLDLRRDDWLAMRSP